MIFAPKNGVEKRVGEFVLFMLPYLNAMTYKFHVEKCREIGIRIEDFYHNKFHKEHYIYHHLY